MIERSSKHQKMMTLGKSLRVRIIENGTKKYTLGEIRVQSWNKKERTLRALKFGGMCWGAGIVSVILPLLHFVLVPTFLFAGPVVAFILIGQEQIILGGEGTCPHCQAFLPIARTSFSSPFSELCSICQSPIQVEFLKLDI